MGSVLGLLRLLAAILILCIAVSPPIDPWGSAGERVAWAGKFDAQHRNLKDDDDKDHDDSDDSDDDDDRDRDDDKDDDDRDDDDRDDDDRDRDDDGDEGSDQDSDRMIDNHDQFGHGGSDGGAGLGGNGADGLDGGTERRFESSSKITGPVANESSETVVWFPGIGSSGETGWRRDANKSAGPGNSPQSANTVGERSDRPAGGPPRPNAGEAVGDELLAMGIDPDEMLALEQAGFRLVDRPYLAALGLGSWRFSLPPGSSLPSALGQAQSLAPGAILEPNYVYRAADRPSSDDCLGPDCSVATLIGWEQIADSCGIGIRIGMTDTGVDPNHPALRGRALHTEVFDPYGEGSVPDHGTAVAGLLVGNANTGFPGMLPGAELFAADVFHTDNAGDSYSTLLSLVQGFDWLVESGVSVVNVSMTGPPNALLEEAVSRMNQRGIVVVAAAGNGGPLAPPAYPAAYGDVVSVTAVDRDLRPYGMANRGSYISFSSPGVQIWSAGPEGSGRHRTGTSFAAAHASAIIADVVRGRGTDAVHRALNALQSTARDLGAPGRDPVFGWGLIQGAPTCQAGSAT